jgi:Mg-chelatase subunit ChlD
MRLATVVLCVTAVPAAADPALQEYNASQTLAPADQLLAGACDIDVALRGAIADVELHQRIRNPGPGELAATFDHDLPLDAKLIGFAYRDQTTQVGVGVATSTTAQVVDAPDVLGPDPAIVQRAWVTDAGRMRYRATVQPIAPGREVMIALRWTQAAEIHDGALAVTLPGKLDAKPCLVRVRAQLGPGATVDKIRAGTTVLPKTSPTFTLTDDATIAVELAFARPEPVAWMQSEPLGDGVTAQALTVIAPPRRAESGPQHAVLVIDTSRSMELVGRTRVRQLVRAIGSALPASTEVEAILFDRTATRVLGAWQPAGPAAITAIEDAIDKRPVQNGSDAVAAMALAHTLVADGGRGQAMIVVITDGVLGELPDDALTNALASRVDAVDVHAIVLDPSHMHSPGSGVLHAPVSRYGGTYIEVDAAALDDAIANVATWLRPAWVEVAAAGMVVPSEVRAGGGFVVTGVATKQTPKLVVTAHSEGTKVALVPRAAPATPIVQLVLPDTADDSFGEGDAGVQKRAKVRATHVAVDGDFDLAVLATSGRVAQHRREMIAGGGPYARMVAVADPPAVPHVIVTPIMANGGSALDHTIIKRLLVDQLQPRAYGCYQRVIGRAPTLAGTATMHVEMSRGEVTRVTMEGLGNAELDACLLDAAYTLSPPMPTPGYNVDDRTLVNYPLAFAVREQKPFVIAGDADSSTPLDISAIKGGPPRLNVDTATPLGNLKPSRSP